MSYTYTRVMRERKKEGGKREQEEKKRKGKKEVGGRGDLGGERGAVLKNRVGPRTNTTRSQELGSHFHHLHKDV